MNDQAKWAEMNEKHLAAVVTWIRLRLLRLSPPAKHRSGEKKGCNLFKRSAGVPAPGQNPKKKPPTDEEIEQAHKEMVELEQNAPPPALILLANHLGLSRFDCHVLALCAALELDTHIAHLCARAHNDLKKPYPTFALAFVLFEDPDWNSLSPHGPIRHWRLIEINQPGAQALTISAIRADERIVNYLKGLNYLDDRITYLVDPLEGRLGNVPLPPSQQQTVDKIVQHLANSDGKGRLPVVELLGHDSASKRLIAGEVAFSLKLNLQTTDLKTLPSQTGDFETFMRLWQRESRLLPLALYIDVNGAGDAEKIHLKRFLEHFSGVIFIDQEDPGTDAGRHRISFAIDQPTPEEQEQLWLEALKGSESHASARLAEQFSFSQNEIDRIAGTVLSDHPQNGENLDDALWQACRFAARVGMGALAQRIDAKATWKRLVLPPEQKELLRQITDQVYQRNRVYEDWGFREIMNRGLGISALFVGESGTGKTMAAEVIANDLKLDLFRIDLSAVVNKYIGETEKNLRKLFDAAEDSGAILFFDEADALFGKRSEVKDSHDRYANIEINYLLQKMEAYRGLAILATNMKSALDKAFLRRLRFIANFPFPDAKARKEIWENVFPGETPGKKTLDYKFLAKHPLTGGSIHNIALNAAFLAAQDGGSVTMPLLLKAARTEFKKLERPMKESDFRWQGHIEVVK
jgi:ATPase family associated with various cellular activities (AAA)/Winged helix domain, variant